MNPHLLEAAKDAPRFATNDHGISAQATIVIGTTLIHDSELAIVDAERRHKAVR